MSTSPEPYITIVWQSSRFEQRPLSLTPAFENLFHLSATMQGTVTAIFEIGCFFGCMLTTLNADRLGHHMVAHIGNAIMILGAV